GVGRPHDHPVRPSPPPRDLVGREARQVRHLIDEFVVDQRPAGETLDHEACDLRPARCVLARDRDEGRYGWRRLRRRSPILSIGMPPWVGTRITRLLLAFISRSTSRYCMVSASGVSV